MPQIDWYIGCSGFSYKEWKGRFYPAGLPQRAWFDHYATQFNTVEINNTFYRFPERKLFSNWYDKAPTGFRFSVKVPQLITHRQRFRNTADLLQDFYSVASEGLKDKLGPVLFQLPPSTFYHEGLLQAMLDQMNPAFNNVIEFRHGSWWRKDVIAVLQKANVVFCGVSYPGLAQNAMPNLPVVYYRFHGVPRLYHSTYSHEFLQEIAKQLRAGETTEAYIYFNNTASLAAIDNARYLQSLVQSPV